MVDYIEEHLLDDEKLSPEEIAKRVLMPSAQFYRLFPFITGVSVREYVRRRRLTLAAQELLSTDVKIIDAAFKYGYESPDSFGRAFLSQHGIPPSGVRKPGVRISAFPRLRFEIKIKGDASMKIEMKKKGAFTVVGRKLQVTGSENAADVVPAFWDKTEKWYADLIGMIGAGTELMGVCADLKKDGSFDYYIAIEQTDSVSAEGYETLEVPASEWACFQSIGPMPRAIQDVWKYVMTEWLPSSGFRHSGTPDLEIYSEGDNSAADYISWVWIPVIKD